MKPTERYHEKFQCVPVKLQYDFAAKIGGVPATGYLPLRAFSIAESTSSADISRADISLSIFATAGGGPSINQRNPCRSE